MVINQFRADCVRALLAAALGGGALFGCIQPSESVDLPPAFTAWVPATQGIDGGSAAPDAAWHSVPELADGDDPGVVEEDSGSPMPPPAQVEDGGSAPVVPSGPHPTALRFEVLTKDQGGRYAPRNIGAIWIENAAGEWIKTLAVWAGVRERHLTRYRDASGGNRVDAVTGATLWFHQTHQVSWDLKDVSGQPVADGDYKIIVEVTDRSGTGESIEIPFSAGASPFELSPPDEPAYAQMRLSYE